MTISSLLIRGALGTASRRTLPLQRSFVQQRPTCLGCRWMSSSDLRSLKSLYLADVSEGSRTPFTLGLFNYFERHLPSVGFYAPIAGAPFPGSGSPGIDRHIELICKVFNLHEDMGNMQGVSEADAAQMVANGKQADLLDQVYDSYQKYAAERDFVLIYGPGNALGGTEMDATVAQALDSPVLMTIQGSPRMTANDYYNLAMVKRQVFLDHKVPVLGVAVNNVPRTSHSILTGQLRERFTKAGLNFAGGIPFDPLLASVRLDEVQAMLGASLLFGRGSSLDKEFSDIIIGSQRVEELLEMLEERPADAPPPLVVTSQDRTDIVLGLLAAQLSVSGPAVAGILLTQAGHPLGGRKYARDIVSKIFHGIEGQGGNGPAGAGATTPQRAAHLPVLYVDKPIFEVMTQVRFQAQKPTILPTSARKITQSKMLFDRHIDIDAVVSGLQQRARLGNAMTPKMFQHNLKALCLKNPQRIVLPEATDARVLTAAAEVTQRGLAKVTLLGDPLAVQAEGKKLGLDLSGVTILNPKTSERLERYVDSLVEARKKKGLPRETALDMVKNDINMFGVMMVHCGDADGMVSGAIHTTAATIRPAMQVLKGPHSPIVSSIFFMCLPDKVMVYGDCAVNVNPSSEELAGIAISSADTAAAFGFEPRVAILSYSTLGSGAGPDVEKVTKAVSLVKSKRPDLKVEGPMQYDAAIDPKVAAVKIKGKSEVAGRATVFIFPDLNTGNNTYKAVQQASGGIAMGPVMQGLAKPVNDLSRGCTVADIVNTVCVTSIQAMQAAAKQAART